MASYACRPAAGNDGLGAPMLTIRVHALREEQTAHMFAYEEETLSKQMAVSLNG